jgi:hypothetical protein
MKWTIEGSPGGWRATCAGVVMVFDGPAELAQVAALAAVRALGGLVATDGGAGPRVPRVAQTPAERAAKSRRLARERAAAGVTDRHAENVTDRDGRHAENVTDRDGGVTGPGVAAASRSGTLPSLSPASGSSLGESENARGGVSVTDRHGERVTDRDAASVTDRDGAGGVPVDLDMPIPAWAVPRVEAMRIANGPRDIDVGLVWRGYVAHVAAQRAAGVPRAIDVAGWSGWLVVEWKITGRRGGKGRGVPWASREVQRDPLGPKSYAVSDGRALLVSSEEEQGT